MVAATVIDLDHDPYAEMLLKPMQMHVKIILY